MEVKKNKKLGTRKEDLI